MSADTDDIVERLREQCNCNIETSPCGAEHECRIAMEAADEIERLRGELDDLKKGRTAIIPHTVKHAQDLYTISERCLSMLTQPDTKAREEKA